jgi:hypothetical protein
MKTTLSILLLVLSIQCYAQSPILDKETLFTKIDSAYAAKTQTQLLEFSDSKKGEWLKYLPTVGLTYTLDGKPRPSINYSTTLLYRATKDKQLKAAKRQQIIRQNQEAASKAKAELEKLLLEYTQLQEEIKLKKQILEIDQQLFDIEKAKYERLEIAPSEFLKAQKDLYNQQLILKKLEQQLVAISLLFKTATLLNE